jgi:hypothetical protein
VISLLIPCDPISSHRHSDQTLVPAAPHHQVPPLRNPPTCSPRAVTTKRVMSRPMEASVTVLFASGRLRFDPRLPPLTAVRGR